MKKVFVLFILFTFIFIPGLFAEVRLFLLPFDGGNGVALDSPAYSRVVQNGSADLWTSAGVPTGVDRNKKIHNIFRKGGYEGKYSDFNMIATGGFTGADKDPDDVYAMTMTLTSPLDFDFMSLKNPNASRRPYEVYVIVKHNLNRNSGDGGEVYDVQKFDKSGQSITWTLPKNRESCPNVGYDFWFDMVLVLPGDRPANPSAPNSLIDENGYLTIDQKKQILILESDDYSGVVNVEISLERTKVGASGKDVIYPPKILSIPLNGHYKAAEQPVIENTSISVSVVPTPYCSNLDLREQQGVYIPVASVHIMSSIISGSDGSNVPNYYIFLSSDPEAWGTKRTDIDTNFMLRHEMIDRTEEYNPRTHMRYSLWLIDNSDIANQVFYRYSGGMKLAAAGADFNNYIVDKTAITGEILDKFAEPVTRTGTGMSGQRGWKEFQGEIGIEMENKHQAEMRAGRYISTIYLHILTND